MESTRITNLLLTFIVFELLVIILYLDSLYNMQKNIIGKIYEDEDIYDLKQEQEVRHDG